jgi:HAD superfamily phosphatase (TIGR01681 family)
MKKLYVFDLDNTLYLWEVKKNIQELYSKQLKQYLAELHNKGAVLAIASHNTNPKRYLRYMDIDNLFTHVIGEYPRSKDTMLAEILLSTGIKHYDTVFFDDMQKNLDLVAKMGIECYKADDIWGISDVIGFEFRNLTEHL